MLKELGIYGFDQIEDILLAALATGDPLLMVGDKGTAKSLLVEKIAQHMEISSIVYSAPMTNAEELYGFPLPDLEKKTVEYVPTPISIWNKGFIVIDEINRARIDTQNLWLQIIRERKLMGEPTSVVYVWGCMNPLSYQGTSPLEEAFADRFAWIVPVPKFYKMETDSKVSILHNLSPYDAPALQKIGKISKIKNKYNILSLVKKTQDKYIEISKELDLDAYLLAFLSLLATSATEKDKDLAENEKRAYLVDGRRAGMIRRNIYSLIAARETLSDSTLVRDDPEGTIKKAIFHSFVGTVSGFELDRKDIELAHSLAKDAISRKVKDPKLQIILEKNPWKKIKKCIELNYHKTDKEFISKQIGEFIHGNAKSSSQLSLPLLAYIVDYFEIELLAEIRNLLYIQVNKALGLDDLLDFSLPQPFNLNISQDNLKLYNLTEEDLSKPYILYFFFIRSRQTKSHPWQEIFKEFLSFFE